MIELDTGLQNLKSQHPEWAPWLAVVHAVLIEATDSKWEAIVPPSAETSDKVPLLANATLHLERSLVRQMLAQIIRIACRDGTAKLATLAPVAEAELDIAELFEASLHQDSDKIKLMAAALGVDGEAFQAVGAVVPVPFLQACNRRWARTVSEGWMEGYCPVCGAWPAFAEIRGIERSRYLRCGRCGAGWQAHGLSCPYCGMTDHNELLSLVPANHALNAVIDACKRCLGYVKTFTKLQGSQPANVMVDDLASVDFDVAAAEHGYKRPPGTGYFLNVTVTENDATRSRFA
jgi:FdhE protein